jgi:hypothetical protein
MVGQMLLPRPKTRSLRVTQGVILLVGAIVIVVAIGASPTGVHPTPATVSLTYLAAAMSCGSQGSDWATLVVLVGWGDAVIVVRQVQPNLDTAGLYLVSAGLGATVGMCVARRGFAVTRRAVCPQRREVHVIRCFEELANSS